MSKRIVHFNWILGPSPYRCDIVWGYNTTLHFDIIRIGSHLWAINSHHFDWRTHYSAEPFSLHNVILYIVWKCCYGWATIYDLHFAIRSTWRHKWRTNWWLWLLLSSSLKKAQWTSGAVIETTPILACNIGFPSSQRRRIPTKLHLSHSKSTFVIEDTRAF